MCNLKIMQSKKSCVHSWLDYEYPLLTGEDLCIIHSYDQCNTPEITSLHFNLESISYLELCERYDNLLMAVNCVMMSTGMSDKYFLCLLTNYT